MRLLVDSNAFLWWRNGSPRLSVRAAAEMQRSDNEVCVSTATLWEIAIKRNLGKLQFLENLEAVMIDENFSLLPIGYPHLEAFERLPLHHRDPFDRMIIAQGLTEGLPIITRDRRFPAYGVQVVW